MITVISAGMVRVEWRTMEGGGYGCFGIPWPNLVYGDFGILDQSHEYSRELINAEYSKYIQTIRLKPSANARM